MSYKKRLPLKFLIACCFFSFGHPVLAAMVTDPYVGASVSGTANNYSLICSTCPIDTVTLPGATSGGPGYASATIDLGNPGYHLAGTAGFAGPKNLPSLGAYAFADILIDSSIPKTYFHQANVISKALQKYTYSGTSSTSYQIDYTLNGNFDMASADPVSLMQVYGGITVYGSNYNPNAEGNPTLGFNYVGANAKDGGFQPFSLSGLVNFTVNPGDSFYVLGNLIAYADSSHQVIGIVDALHTLNMNFSSGDTTLLQPEISSVPLPGAIWLFAMGGIGFFGGFRRNMPRAGQ